MAKYCTNCGKELDENVALCLNCGVLVENNTTRKNNNEANQKRKRLPTWVIVIIIIGSLLLLPIIFIVIVGMIAYNVIDGTISNVEEYIEEKETQTGVIGDTLTTDEFNIKLYDVKTYMNIGTDENSLDVPNEGKEYLVFFFDVKNISDDNEYISEYDFTGYEDGYEVEIVSLYNDVEKIKELNANLPPNKKTKGYVAFEVDKTWKEFEIHYSNWFENNEVIFTVVNEKNTNITGA